MRISRAFAAIVAVFLVGAAAAAAATWVTGLAGGSRGEARSALLELESTIGSNNCLSSASGATSCATATGSPVPAGPLSSSSSSSPVTTILTSTGSANASSATVASASCGVAELADAGSDSSWGGSGSNTALPIGGLTYQPSGGPLSNSQAITTDGTTGWAETVGQYNNPESFTVLAWFKTSSATGSIIGFSSNQTAPASAANYERILWVDSAGNLVWGVSSGGGQTEVKSSGTNYANGAWHFVAASVGASGTQLDVDGTLTSSANTTAQTYDG